LHQLSLLVQANRRLQDGRVGIAHELWNCPSNVGNIALLPDTLVFFLKRDRGIDAAIALFWYRFHVTIFESNLTLTPALVSG